MRYSVRSGEFSVHGRTVSDDHFGAVYSTFYGLHAYEKQSAELGVTNIRWPGGTRGEYQRDENDVDQDGNRTEYLFDLANKDLLEIDGKGLSDVVSYARERDIDLTIFLPSNRYLGDPALARRETAEFAKRLVNGDFGELTDNLTIEIGNETLTGNLGRAKEYGKVANAQIGALRRVFDSSESDLTNVDIAVQIGRSAREDLAIRNQINEKNLAEIDGLIAHHLPINIVNHNKIRNADHSLDDGDSRFTRNIDYVSKWEKAVAKAAGYVEYDLDLHVTAWTVGSSSEIADDDLAWNDIGARQARTTIDTFVNLIGVGADTMFLWGVDGRPNPNFYSRPSDGGIELSHGGVAFKMMASSLVGKGLHADFKQVWTNTGRNENDAGIYVFEDASQYVVFLTANEISKPVTLNLSFEHLSNNRAIQVMSLTTELDQKAPRNLDEDELREWERPVTTSASFYSETDEFDFVLESSYDVHRLTIWKDHSDEEIADTLSLQSEKVVHRVDAPGINRMWKSDMNDEIVAFDESGDHFYL